MLSQVNDKTWGLFHKDSQSAIPLKSLDISIQIVHNVTRVFYTQVYHNNSNSLLESEFFFPISPDACFDSFEAKFNDTIIKGIVKEKNQAKEEYKEAISKGNIAAYSEINKATGDLMKVMLGNIPPNAEISIKYSYIQKLETSLGKFWCFRLFSTFTPRFNGDLNEYLKRDIALLATYPTINTSNSQAYPWNIQVDIQSPSPIKYLQSPSHSIVTQYGNENHTCKVTLDPNSNYYPNKDFVLLYSNGKENKVDYLLTPFEDQYCAMVTLLADFGKISSEETYNNFAKAKEPEESFSMNSIRGEYIFLIDRSGSMEGERITMAKASLQLFLKSLPKDSYFNVVSFGSSYAFLHEKSIAYSLESLKASSNQVETFDADMGGTEIYEGLEAIFNRTPLQKGYPRFIFLLTDGSVSNTEKVLNLISKNNEETRVFTIGIGNGCSPELITKGAFYGRGKHEFVADTKDIYTKVISLLDASLSPSYSDISLEGDNFDAVVKSVSPNPASVPFLLNGQPITFFLFLHESAFKDVKTMPLKLKLYDSRIRSHRTVEIILDISEVLQNDLIPKLAIHDMIKRLEEQKTGLSNTEEQVLWMSKQDIKQALLDLSLAYGILCKETAFFCEIARNNEEAKTLQQVKVIVPTTLSKDYFDPFSISTPLNRVSSFSASPRLCAINDEHLYEEEQKCYLVCDMEEEEEVIGKEQMNYEECGDTFENSGCMMLSRNEPEREITNIGSQSASNSCSSYLDVIMKQNFEGFWNSADQDLKNAILKSGNLSEVPAEVKIDSSQAETAWITILVLFWLEVVCQKDKQAWRLIHQKGCEWLESVGINYDEVKELGKSLIKA